MLTIEQRDSNSLLFQCHEIIQQQQHHIDKLEQELNRKDSIIVHLLSNNNKVRSKGKIQENHEESLQLQSVIKLNHQLHQKYQNAIYELQFIKLNAQKRNQQVIETQKRCKFLEDKQESLIQQNSQYNNTLKRIKQAYETKISLLLNQIKNSTLRSVTNSKLNQRNNAIDSYNQKQNLNYTCDLNGKQGYIKDKMKTAQKQIASTYQEQGILTPDKAIKSYNERYTVKNSQSTGVSTSRKKLLQNTPYKNCNNFIAIRSKPFPPAQSQIYSKNQLNSCPSDHTNKKTCNNLKNNRFVSDSSYSQNQNQSSQSFNQSICTNDKIPIKKILNQFAEYNSKQGILQQKSHEKQNKNKLKINQILEALTSKIKKIESKSFDVSELQD